MLSPPWNVWRGNVSSFPLAAVKQVSNLRSANWMFLLTTWNLEQVIYKIKVHLEIIHSGFVVQ